MYGGLNEKPLPQAHGCEHFIPIWWGHLGRLGNIWVVDPCWGSMSRRVSSEGLWSCPTFSFLLSPPVFTPLSPLSSSSLNRKLPTPACGHAFPTMMDFYTSDPQAKINYSLSCFSSGILAQQLLRVLLCLRVHERCRAHCILLRAEYSWDTVFGLRAPL